MGPCVATPWDGVRERCNAAMPGHEMREVASQIGRDTAFPRHSDLIGKLDRENCLLATVGGVSNFFMRGLLPPKSGAMRRVMAAALLCFIGCSQSPSEEDQRRLAAIRAAYPSYEFTVESDLYLRAHKKSDDIPEGEAEEIFRRFWMTGSGEPRTNSTYVYLNVYANSSFQHQVSWDPKSKRIMRSSTEHY